MQWNLGGWLGGQLGGTCWILVAAVMALPLDLRLGAIVLALFVIPNLIGWRLWSARDRLSPLAGTQAMILVAGGFSLATIYVLDRAGAWEAIQVGGRVSAGAAYGVVIAVYGGLLALFHLLARQAKP